MQGECLNARTRHVVDLRNFADALIVGAGTVITLPILLKQKIKQYSNSQAYKSHASGLSAHHVGWS